MWQWLKFYFGGGIKARIHELDGKFCRSVKLIEAQRTFIQNLQKEIAVGVLERSALADRITALEKAASKPVAIKAPNWRSYLKLTEDESVTT